MGKQRRVSPLQQKIVQVAAEQPAWTHKQIAARVGCHPSTVDAHLKNAPRRGRGGGQRTAASAQTASLTAPAETNEEAVRRMAPFGNPRDYLALAKMEECPPRVLARFLGSHLENVRVAAAGNPSTPSRALMDLYLTRDPQIAAALASNRNCWPGTLRSVAFYHPATHFAILANPSADGDVLDVVAKHTRDASVRAAVASHRAVSQYTLGSLAAGSDVGVRAVAVAKIRPTLATFAAELERAMADPEPRVRRAAASNRYVSEERQERIMRDSAAGVRAALAANPETAQRHLGQLAADPDPAVRAAAGSNPETAQRHLGQLAADPDPAVRAAAGSNPNASRRQRRRAGRGG